MHRTALVTLIRHTTVMAVRSQPSSNMAKFHEILSRSKHVVVLSGAGVSAESGIPTFRGSGGFWRTFQAQDLATPGAFARDPSLVWEFYHYRRELVLTKEPNKVLYKLNRHFPKLMHVLEHFRSSISLVYLSYWESSYTGQDYGWLFSIFPDYSKDSNFK